MNYQPGLADAIKQDELRRRVKIEELLRLAVAFGWDLAATGHPRPTVIDLRWDDEGNARFDCR